MNLQNGNDVTFRVQSEDGSLQNRNHKQRVQSEYGHRLNLQSGYDIIFQEQRVQIGDGHRQSLQYRRDS